MRHSFGTRVDECASFEPLAKLVFYAALQNGSRRPRRTVSGVGAIEANESDQRKRVIEGSE